MERDSLDLLSRSLATGLSRRDLTGIVGLGVVSWLAAPDDLVAGKKKKKKKSCKAPTKRCGKTCTNVNSDVFNCGGCGKKCDFGRGESCTNGVCGCRVGAVKCSVGGGAGICTDITSNDTNCGACFQECPFAFDCQNGVCVEGPEPW